MESIESDERTPNSSENIDKVETAEVSKDSGTGEEEHEEEEPIVDSNKENSGEIDANPDYDPKDITYEGDVAIYTDPKSNYKYKWDSEKNEWVPNVEYGYENDTHTYTDAEGVKYFWDKEKSAWFPEIDDNFMAQYQMNYGFIDNTSTPKSPPSKDPQKNTIESKSKDNNSSENKETGVKRKPSEPSWFDVDEKQNTKVYVSNLPADITEEEFIELMSKYGIIMRDINTNQLKIKLYMDPENKIFKGDGLCSYVRRESVDLALKLLDGLEFKGKILHVELAKFQMKGAYDPKLKPKTKKRKEKEKIRKQQEKMFDWRPEKKRGERAKHERVVILKNVFDPKMFDENVSLILELQEDLREECAKCGNVRKVVIFDRHPEGVAQVNMQDAESAEACVLLLNNRWFSQRQITAEIWNGKTKFRIAETDSEINQRLEKWDEFLESEQKEKEAAAELSK